MPDPLVLLKYFEMGSRALQMAPAAVKLAVAVDRARQGDKKAVEWLKTVGWREGVNLFLENGDQAVDQISAHGKAALDTAKRAIRGDLNVVDADFRILSDEPDRAPWQHFTRWLANRTWGSFVLLGPKGSGKTTLALRLAMVWHQRTGWPIEAINLYDDNALPFIYPVAPTVFLERVRKLNEILNPPKDEGEDAGKPRLTMDEWAEQIKPKVAPYKKRIVICDEASLWIGRSGQDKGRAALIGLMAQLRHIDYLLIVIAQTTRMLPLESLNCEAIFVKQPLGRESQADRADTPFIRDIWTAAGQGFEDIRQTDWWRDDPAHGLSNDPRAWAYADAPDVGGGHPYRGMMPFNRPMSDAQDGS